MIYLRMRAPQTNNTEADVAENHGNVEVEDVINNNNYTTEEDAEEFEEHKADGADGAENYENERDDQEIRESEDSSERKD